MMDQKSLAGIFSSFSARVEYHSAEVLAGGLINRSWVATAQTGERFVLQQLNEQVFSRPEHVMENILRVTGHLRDKAETTLNFLPLMEDSERYLHRDASGRIWRMCPYLENTRAEAKLTCPEDAETAGRAYGRFLKNMADFPAEDLHETIPGFHDTARRWAALLQAHLEDVCGRASLVDQEMSALWARADVARGFAVLDLPVRTAHNDAKLANVLLDTGTGQAVCVVDLDTVMPGTALADFGDMLRTMCCWADEEETDLSRVLIEPELLEGLARGYLAEAGDILVTEESHHLLAAGMIITFEQAVRYLTDYLEGDVYYQTSRPEHNLDRCRNQLQLLASMYERREELARVLP